MEKKDCILTRLPLVYKHNCQLLVGEGVDLKRKDELWGIQLSSGIMVALKCDDFISCKEARDKKSFNSTVKVLKEYGIDADPYLGMVWCILCPVLRCSLPLGGGKNVSKNRLAVAF